MTQVKQIQLTSHKHFYSCWQAYKSFVKRDVQAAISYFEPYFNILPKLAMGEYYWNIFDNGFPASKILYAGGAVEKLTPYTLNDYLKITPHEYFSIMHPDDVNYAFSFLGKSFRMLFALPKNERNNYNVTIYYRVKNAKGDYLWNAMQCPALYFDDNGRFLYGLSIYSDVTHLMQPDAKPMMTILNNTGKTQQVFTCYTPENVDYLETEYAIITKREKEIIALLAQGKASKEIAYILGLAKNTVDNYRQKLLKKFNASSSTELVIKANFFKAAHRA